MFENLPDRDHLTQPIEVQRWSSVARSAGRWYRFGQGRGDHFPSKPKRNSTTSVQAATTQRTVAQADTQLDHVTRAANAELTWTFTAAATNRQYIQGEAAKAEQLAQALSTADRTYTRLAADETAARDNAFATHLVGLWNDQQTADNQWNADVATAQADLWTAEYREKKNSLVGFVSSTAGLPWAQFRYDLAVAKESSCCYSAVRSFHHVSIFWITLSRVSFDSVEK